MPFPIGTERKISRLPYVTYLLMLVNLGVTAWWTFGTGADSVILRDYGFVPAAPTWYGIFTSMFLHGGWMHVGFNMLYLVIFGRHLEEVMGPVLFAATYFVCGIFAAVLHMAVVTVFLPAEIWVPMVGASGAISGLLGVFAVRFYKTAVYVWMPTLTLFGPRVSVWRIPSLVVIGIWLFLQVYEGVRSVQGLQTSVAEWAHVGGLVFGMGYALLVNLEAEGRSEYDLAAARAALQKGEFLDAERISRNLLRANPLLVDAQLVLGETLLQQSHRPLEEAVAAYSAATRQLLAAGKQDAALAAYRALKTDAPHAVLKPAEQFAIACELARQRSYEDAAFAFEQFAHQYPDAPECAAALLKAAQLFLDHLRQPQHAAVLFQRLLDRFPESDFAVFARQGCQRARSEGG